MVNVRSFIAFYYFTTRTLHEIPVAANCMSHVEVQVALPVNYTVIHHLSSSRRNRRKRRLLKLPSNIRIINLPPFHFQL